MLGLQDTATRGDTVAFKMPVGVADEVSGSRRLERRDRYTREGLRLADSPAFDWVCSELERRTALDRLEARGTVRLALKQAGLDGQALTPDQLKVVLEKVMPKELGMRGVEDADGVCQALAGEALGIDAGPSRGDETPEAVFQRLAGAAS